MDPGDRVAAEGRQAGRLGRPVSDLPHNLRETERRAWRAGWLLGHEEAEAWHAQWGGRGVLDRHGPPGVRRSSAGRGDGGVVLSTTTPAPAGDGRGVRGVDVYLRSDAGQVATLVAMVDAGEVRVDVGERLPLAQLPAVHAQAVAGGLPGKVVLLPAA